MELKQSLYCLAFSVRIGWPLLVTVFLAATRIAGGATVLFSSLAQLDGWDLNTLGTARMALSAAGPGLPCVEMNSAGGTCLLSRKRRLEAEAPLQLFGHEFCARVAVTDATAEESTGSHMEPKTAAKRENPVFSMGNVS